MKMMLGNQIGFELDKTFNENELFAQCYGAFLCELDKPLEMPGSAILLGHTTKGYSLKTGSATIQMDKLQKIYEDKLQPVFPYLSQEEEKPVQTFSYACANPAKAAFKTAKPHVLIPVFPGTNCEYDTARAFERARCGGRDLCYSQSDAAGYRGIGAGISESDCQKARLLPFQEGSPAAMSRKVPANLSLLFSAIHRLKSGYTSCFKTATV